MSDSNLKRLIFVANLKLRAQRGFDTLFTGALPVLVALCLSTLLAKTHWLDWPTFYSIVVGLASLLGTAVLLGALWPIPPLRTLVAIDEGNDFSDRLSSAWDFLNIPMDRRTPEMQLHVERTLAQIDHVKASRAHPFQRPRDVWGTAGLLCAFVVVGLLAEPVFEVPPLQAAVEPPPEIIVDVAALREPLRQLEILERLADETDDPHIRALHHDLADILTRLERGQIGHEELLDRLDEFDERLATLEQELDSAETVDLQPMWEDVGSELQKFIDEEEDLTAAVVDQAEALIDAIEEGDQVAIADALDAAAALIEEDSLSQDEREELADMFEALADVIDPTDPDLLAALAELADDIAGLEERLANRDRSRDRDRLAEAQSQLAAAQAERDEAQGQMGRTAQAQQDLRDVLQEAADDLREPSVAEETGEGSATPLDAEGNDREDGTAASQNTEASDQNDASSESDAQDNGDAQASESGNEDESVEGAETRTTTDENLATDTADEREPGQEQNADGQPEDGNNAEQSADARPQDQNSQDQNGANGQPPSQSDPNGPSETGRADPDESAQDPDSPGQEGEGGQTPRPSEQQDPAARSLAEASDTLDEINDEQSRDEAVERSRSASDEIRENLQQSTGEPPNDQATADEQQAWDDFMDRAEGGEGDDSSEDLAEGQGGESATDQEGDGHEGQREGEGGNEDESSSYGDAEDNRPLGDENDELDSERQRQRASTVSAEGGDEELVLDEVMSLADSRGFATQVYQDIYVEYAEANEAVLEAINIPAGYERFIERYFRSIEPRQ